MYFKYKTLDITSRKLADTEKLEEELNSLGHEGFELIQNHNGLLIFSKVHNGNYTDKVQSFENFEKERLEAKAERRADLDMTKKGDVVTVNNVQDRVVSEVSANNGKVTTIDLGGKTRKSDEAKVAVDNVFKNKYPDAQNLVTDENKIDPTSNTVGDIRKLHDPEDFEKAMTVSPSATPAKEQSKDLKKSSPEAEPMVKTSKKSDVKTHKVDVADASAKTSSKE